MNTKERVVSYIESLDDSKIQILAIKFGLDSEGWVTLESSYSGDYASTAYGKLTWTNGHFSLSGISKTFWLNDFPSDIMVITFHGMPACCGTAKFHIKRLEDYLSNKGYKCLV